MIYHEFAPELRIDMERLQGFIERGWVSPLLLNGGLMFRDVDLARAALISDLANEMGVNDEGIDVVLDLLDQLYSLRCVLGNLLDALEVQPLGTRRPVVDGVQILDTRIRQRAHSVITL